MQNLHVRCVHASAPELNDDSYERCNCFVDIIMLFCDCLSCDHLT